MNLLAFDSESFPNVGLTWGTWDQRVIKVLKRRMVCSISWQWLGKKNVEHMALPDFGGYVKGGLLMPDAWIGHSVRMMRAFKAQVLSKCDVAIAHNLAEFDDKMVATDMLIGKVSPAAPHRQIDTLRECRQHFRLNSNKLDDVCEELGIGKKLKHPGIEMWTGCMDGDPRMWNWMYKYNNHDVAPLLTGLYAHLRPWMRRHPNVGVENTHACCPSCAAHERYIKTDGMRHTQALSYKKSLCTKCKSWCMGVVVKGKLRYRSF